MMKLVLVLSILTIIQAEVTQDGILINGVRYYREILRENLPNTNYYGSSLAVVYSTNELYSSAYDKGVFKLNVLNLNTKEFKYISGVDNPHSITVDQVAKDVYVGNSSGIYRYRPRTNKVLLTGAQNADVWKIYFKKVIYYVTVSSDEIKTLIHGKSAKYETLHTYPFDFVVDNEENIVYTNYERVYYHKKGTENDNLYEIIEVTSLTTDRNGKVYFSAEDGIYEIKNDSTCEKMVSIQNPRQIAFDNENNLIYYSYKDLKLYRLKWLIL